MAQYTTILAEEYNSLKRTMAKILGPATAQNRYGYNTSLLTSSDVSGGQLIKKDEWITLKADINTARFYQARTLPTVTVPVKGDTIYWADVVTYQNAVSTAETAAYNQTTYTEPGKYSTTYVHLGSTQGGDGFSGPWGGGTDGVRVLKRYHSRVTWGSTAELIAFFNLGGYVFPSIYATGTGTTTKDSAVNYICTVIGGISINWTTWWNSLGGAANTGNIAYTVTATTTGNATYSPYNTSGRQIEGAVSYYWNGSNTIEIYASVADFDTSANPTWGTPAVPIHYGVTAITVARYPNGPAPSSVYSGASGSAIAKTAPTISSPEGTYWY
jgi:hypothetical protein